MKNARAAVRSYLKNRQATLWGQHFDLSQHSSRDAAEDFIVKVIEEVEQAAAAEWVPKHFPKSSAAFDVVG